MKTPGTCGLVAVTVVLLLTLQPGLAAAEPKPGSAPVETPGKFGAPPKPRGLVGQDLYRPNQSPYRAYLPLEIPLLVIGTVAVGAPQFFISEALSPWCGLSCDPGELNPLDRLAVDLSSQTARDVSDALFYTSVALPYVLTAIDVAVSGPRDGWGGFWIDSLVILESVGLTYWVQNLLAFATRRPRPLVYNQDFDDEQRLSGGASMSFPSGHTATAFAAATAYSRTFMLRHPNSPLVIPVWIFTESLAAGTGVLRIFAGAHFPTDVMVGAVIGVGAGLLVPWLHRLPRIEVRSPRDGTTALMVRPYLAGQGAGLAGTF